MTNSKKKGDKFERKIAKILGDWWGVKFNRTPQSGGASWASSNNAVGDILPPAHAGFPLVIECKHREEWTMDNVLLNNREPHTWWAQVIGDSSTVNKAPCLIFTRNRGSIYVALPYIEQVYLDLRDKSFPIMRTDFIIENIRKDKLYYDVLITTIDGLTSLPTSYIISHYGNFKTTEYKLVESEVTKKTSIEDDTIIDDLLNNI